MLANDRCTSGKSPQETDLFVSLPVAALTFDHTRSCRRANRRAEELLGGDPVGRTIEALFAGWTAVPELETHDSAPVPSVIAAPDGRRFVGQTDLDPATALSCLTLTDIGALLTAAQRDARDSLTGLIQRGALKDRLADAVARARRERTGAAVLFIDLDRFKAVNDTLGHAVGDALLVKVAERLSRTLRQGDVLARQGGDEFVIVQHAANTPDAVGTLAKRLIDLVGRTYVIHGHLVNVGVSVGVAMFPQDAGDADTLLRRADLALYRAKADGRGLARFYEPSMDARMQARRLLEIDLRRALALRQLRLCFQPLMQLDTDKVTGFEALLRWDHPERGPVEPADFIPLAEELGLIVPIGDWVLRTACREAMSWPSPATVAVNISPVQFKGGKLAHTVAAALERTGLPAARLELEITEGALLDETTLVLDTLHAIRGLGVRICMDDFGTGYSSLSYLRKFPFDKIKIDQSFVRGLGGDADCDAIVRALAGLGASLGMRTTAEGVETSDQFDRIRAEGCTEVQGYFTGRPLEAAAVTSLLDEQTKGARHAA